ncbi:LysM domain-containing protein, partial [Streptomyces sp. NPDC051940]|uniref:LysM peptidoglycan-binding domain-containing protein n=1 Tax=Streptomyces sp. NPDC051940 TaxID=3155675 RepID=UPI00343786AE
RGRRLPRRRGGRRGPARHRRGRDVRRWARAGRDDAKARERSAARAERRARAEERAAARREVEAKRGSRTVFRAFYVVEPGDTLDEIARDHDVDGGWRELYAANAVTIGSDPDLIRPGQELKIT